jgi:hypothetical protein
MKLAQPQHDPAEARAPELTARSRWIEMSDVGDQKRGIGSRLVVQLVMLLPRNQSKP